MSDFQGKPIESVAEQGPGLVFEVYPEAIATLPGSQVWSCLFFVTMIMLGMDSAVSFLTHSYFLELLNTTSLIHCRYHSVMQF